MTLPMFPTRARLPHADRRAFTKGQACVGRSLKDQPCPYPAREIRNGQPVCRRHFRVGAMRFAAVALLLLLAGCDPCVPRDGWFRQCVYDCVTKSGRDQLVCEFACWQMHLRDNDCPLPPEFVER